MKQPLFFLICFCLTFSVIAEAKSSSGMDFKNIEDPAEHIALERKAALAEEKLLLWVLGGDWCHDSRSLASKLATPEMQTIIDKHYRLSTISVGYLNAGFEFTQIANMLTFYATPTVLIIEPENMQLLNAHDMHIWANADLVSMADTLSYMQRYSTAKIPESSNLELTDLSNKQKMLAVALNDFIQEQEQRIRNSYLIVGPYLEQYKAGVSNPEFEKSWQALATLRMALPKIIEKNREIIKAGESDELDLTDESLKPLPWETSL